MSNPLIPERSAEEIGTLIYNSSRTAAARAKAATTNPPSPPAAADQSPTPKRSTRSSSCRTAKKMAEKTSPIRTSRSKQKHNTPWQVTWSLRFAELAAYKTKRGTCNVPQSYPKLGLWVHSQRVKYKLFKDGKKSTMTDEKVAKLESIGFNWCFRQALWAEMFQSLKSYKTKHGNCNVPRGFKEIPKLALWVKKQRCNYNSSQMAEERIEKLESIGFEWRLAKAETMHPPSPPAAADQSPTPKRSTRSSSGRTAEKMAEKSGFE